MRKILVLLAALLLLCGCSRTPAEPVPEYVLTYAENQPDGYPTVLGARRFAELVREATGGKVIIQIKYGGEFGSEAEVLEQMAFGGIDFARVSLAELSDEIPKLNVLQLPFLYEDADHMWRILDGQIGEDFLTVFDQAGLVGLSWYDAGARCFYTDAHPIRTPADMAGLTVRVQDSQLVIDMVKALGAEPVTFHYGDVSYAFEMHKIDVAENNWPAMAPWSITAWQNSTPWTSTAASRRSSLPAAAPGKNSPRNTGRSSPPAPGNPPCTSGSCGGSRRASTAPMPSPPEPWRSS